MNTSSIALCIPAYNAAYFLPRLLNSALRQTSPFNEIWVYDDCSCDDTASIAERLGARVVRGERQVGCASGKNALAARTACEWIHFHDADDDLRPDFVARARAYAARPDCPDVVLFDYEYRDLVTGELICLRLFDDHALRTDPLRYTITEQINPFCGLYRRSSFTTAGGYDTDPSILYNEDCAFHIRLALAGLSFGAESGSPAIINFRREGSMSSANPIRCATARLALLTKTASKAPARVHADIGRQAWVCARQFASYQLPSNLSAAVRLARNLGVRAPPIEPRWLQICALIAPVTAFRARAWAVSVRNWASQSGS
jgi:hypothetical protein